MARDKTNSLQICIRTINYEGICVKRIQNLKVRLEEPPSRAWGPYLKVRSVGDGQRPRVTGHTAADPPARQAAPSLPNTGHCKAD